MAARLRGSGASDLVLYNAPDWRERVHLMMRDCLVDTSALSNPVSAIASGLAKLMPNGTAASTDDLPVAETRVAHDVIAGASVVSSTWDPAKTGCVQSSMGSTLVKSSALPTYAAQTPKSRGFRSILMVGQPFAYAGDVTLTAVQAGDGEYFVSVDRLYGNEVNEYTMVNVLSRFPANPPPDTIKLGGRMQERVDKLPIPYSFSDMGGVQHPAVSTRSSVYFAVNPSLAMFKGFARGCATNGTEWMLQLSALSSYAPIRVWRIDPFAYCPWSGDGATDRCGIGRVKFADIPDAFTDIMPEGYNGTDTPNVFDVRKCFVPFAVSVVGLEYVNDENIAVTVLRASLADYDPTTGLLRQNGRSVSYQVYFLSTETMGLSDIPWERDVMVAATSAAEGRLCPAMRRLPNLGSLGAELSVAGVELIRKVLDIAMLLPALVKMWGAQQVCPLVTHGHSLLQRCGADLLSLDEFFDALNRANAHFWRSFSLIAERVRTLNADRIANVIDGVAYYGEATISPTQAYMSFVSAVRIPTKEMGTQMIQGIVPLTASALGNQLTMGVNPLRLTQFSYNLVASVVSAIIPLSIRLGKNSGDVDAARQMLAVLYDKLYQAREVYHASITLGMVQGCNGVSLMLGYTNPWAIFVRKQCEAVPIAVQGAYDLAMAMLVDVPFAKCMCVDAAAHGSNFVRYAMDNCYYFAPMHLKPTILGLIENAQSASSASVRASCVAMVEFSKSGVKNSMQPWFDAQFKSTQAMASSLDYVLSFISSEAGRCMDFSNNPYTTVLLPEPMDYFSSCAQTSMCEAKCGAEFRAFDHQLAFEEAMHLMVPVSKSVERTTESMLFVDLDEDAFTPMNILAMAELSDCRPICGGQSEAAPNAVNKDTCIAIAGLPANNTVCVRKYCVPKAQGKGVRGAPTETWFVWFSEDFSDTIVDVKFLDTIAGDALVVLRDNKGRSLKSGLPEQFVSVHSRVTQNNPTTYDQMFSTPELRNERTRLVGMSSEVEGFNAEEQELLALTDMLVIPTGKSDQRQPWVLLSAIVSAREGASAITESYRIDVCITFNPTSFAANLGVLQTNPYVCDLGGLFDLMRTAGYSAVVLDRSDSPQTKADVALLPGQKGYDACILQLQFDGLYHIAKEQRKTCFTTPDAFVTGANFPTRNSWSDMQREMFLGMDSMRQMSMTAQGAMVLARRVVSQNSPSIVNLDDPDASQSPKTGKIEVFSTGDPGANTHWLKQVRIGIYSDGSVSSKSMHSLPVQATVVTYHSCDRKSCLGCASLKLQSLCYAAQQCAVVQCVGTVVNQNRPLCNAGLVLKSNADSILAMVLGGWLVFTESYTMILDAALLGPSQRLDVEWVDDAFYGYVCTAKDTMGQATSILTSTVGAAIVFGHKKMMQRERMSQGLGQAGTSELTGDAFTASVTMVLNGVNAMLYQMVLLPLYMMIAAQKTMVCTTNDMFALIDASGFTVRVGRPDLQNASNVATGVCLTAFFESSVHSIGESGTKGALMEGADGLMRASSHGSATYKLPTQSSTATARTVELFAASGSKSKAMQALRDAASPATRGGERGKTLFERFRGTQILSKIGSAMGNVYLQPMLHILDSMLTYSIGVVSGMQDMAQVIDSAHCKMPDFYIFQTPRCACGDDAVRIPHPRRSEGIAEKAHWCTGTLHMTDGFGNPRYVYNPLTYDELRAALSGKVDRYLECISKRGQVVSEQEEGEDDGEPCPNLKPSVPVLDSQQVSAIAVLERCKSNYQQKQWDAGAYVLYDANLSEELASSGSIAPPRMDPDDPVGKCLLRAEKTKQSNLACMNDYLQSKYYDESTSAVFWRYEKVSLTTTTSTDEVDACIVFSGPAKKTDESATTLEFRKCSHDYTDTGCVIPHMVWSSSSKNKVPVATLHTVEEVNPEDREETAVARFAEARKMAIDALTAMENFTDTNLEVVLFSGEGDALHQIFDCMVLGPMARVDFWDRGVSKDLEVPFWARDPSEQGEDRKLDLPCFGNKLKGDYNPPFTCGSDTRRSIIKYFVRDEINSNSEGNTLAEQLVRERIKLLKEAWKDTAKYACECTSTKEVGLYGKYNLLCCKTFEEAAAGQTCTCLDGETVSAACCENGNNFLPRPLQVLFDEIPAEDVVDAVVSKVPGFVKKIMTTRAGNRAFTKYNDPEKVKRWDWIAQGLGEVATKGSSLFSTSEPVMGYNASEAGFPFKRDQTIWEMCAGLVGQVMFTMPLAPLVVNKTSGDWMWTAASVLNLRGPKLAFDPALPKDFDGDSGAKASGLSMLERYVSKLLDASFSDSPLFWHYAMRHVPSTSLMCAKDYLATNHKPNGSSIPYANDLSSSVPDVMGAVPSSGGIVAHGYGAFPLGGVSSACFCGWTRVQSKRCKVPEPICRGVQYDRTRADCTYEVGSTEGESLLGVILDMWPDLAAQNATSCPEMDLSDAWGVISAKDSDAWIRSGAQRTTTLQMRISELLRSGRAGLRVGNAATLEAEARGGGVWPSARVHKLKPADDPESPGVGLRRCADTIMADLDPVSLAREVVDDLFPVAQGVHESAPVSVCLRFAIEYTRMRMLKAMPASSTIVEDEIRRQKSVVDTWKGRCETQLDMLAVCKGNALFETVPAVQIAYSCPFTVADDYALGKYYVTPNGGCLVYHKPTDAFYNPCRMSTKPCEMAQKPSLTLAQITGATESANTLVRFDVRSTSGSSEILGSWPIRFYDADVEKNKVAAQIVERILRWEATSSSSSSEAEFEAANVGESNLRRGANLPWRLSERFVREILEQGGTGDAARGSVGNVHPSWKKGWAQAEGLVNAQEEVAEFCDTVADWWPDDWSKPVGYHVTLPCSKDQAGYRTFDAAFAVDRGDGTVAVTTTTTKKYMHTMLRDQETYHSR